MSLGAQSSLVMIVSLALYVILPLVLLVRGWPMRAGLAMLFAAFLPLLWQGMFTDSNAPGFGVLLILTLPLPILLIAIGVILACYRGGAWAVQCIKCGLSNT